MPPEIAPACHVHACPEPRSYCRQHLGGLGSGVVGIIVISITVGGSIGNDLRLGFKVPKNEESGEGGGEEDENEPERTHFDFAFSGGRRDAVGNDLLEVRIGRKAK